MGIQHFNTPGMWQWCEACTWERVFKIRAASVCRGGGVCVCVNILPKPSSAQPARTPAEVAPGCLLLCFSMGKVFMLTCLVCQVNWGPADRTVKHIGDQAGNHRPRRLLTFIRGIRRSISGSSCRREIRPMILLRIKPYSPHSSQHWPTVRWVVPVVRKWF